MSWTDRQLAMLREMGLTLWWPGAAPRGAGRREAAADAGVVEAQPPATAPAVDVASAQPDTPPARETAVRAVTTRTPAPVAGSGSGAGTAPSGRRPAGVEQMGWEALRAAVAGCTACQLCSSRTQTVFGVGHAQAQWMIVGEAPGEQEDRQGEPFVGRAGQLLDRMLAALGLARGEGSAEQQVYIANVLKCRPPGNRNPTPEEVAQCEPYLERQVQLVRPRIILAMGRFAVQSILRTSEPVGKLRGRVHHYAGVPVIVTYHPAYLLRNPADKALAWDDLCLAREVLERSPAPGRDGGA